MSNEYFCVLEIITMKLSLLSSCAIGVGLMFLLLPMSLIALKSVSLNYSQNRKDIIMEAEVGEDKSIDCNYEVKQPYGITWYKVMAN